MPPVRELTGTRGCFCSVLDVARLKCITFLQMQRARVLSVPIAMQQGLRIGKQHETTLGGEERSSVLV